MKYLSVRWKNTFEGQSFIDGLKLLAKPAVKPTITDDDDDDNNKNKKENNKNENIKNKNKY